MLNYAAVSPISLPDGVRFWMDESFRIGDRSFRRGQKVVYGEDTPKYFLLECRSKGKKRITFVNKNDIKESNKQYIDIMVVDNLYQINEARGVQADEFNTYKADWQSTVVPLSRHGTGQSSGRAVINSLRPQERLWARKVFDRGFDINREDWGLLPLSFEKIYWRLNNPSAIITRRITTRFQGYFDSELNVRDDNERRDEVYVREDIDVDDYPFVSWITSIKVHYTNYSFPEVLSSGDGYSPAAPSPIMDHRGAVVTRNSHGFFHEANSLQLVGRTVNYPSNSFGTVYERNFIKNSLLVRGDDSRFKKDDPDGSYQFSYPNTGRNKPSHAIVNNTFPLYGLTICSRI